MIKDLQRTTLNQEVLKVINDGSKPVFYRYELTIHVDSNVIRPFYIEEVVSYRDFTSMYHEELSITAAFAASDFNHGIMPYNNRLEATLRKIPIAGMYSTQIKKDQDIKGQRYNAHLYENGSSLIESNMYGNNFPTVADRGGLVSVRIQLVDKLIDRLRGQPIATVVKDTPALDTIRTIFDTYTQFHAKEIGAEFLGVDVVPGWNQTAPKQIAFKTGTRLLGPEKSVPRIANSCQGGVYPSGLAYHFQAGRWYIFPPFDVKRFEESDRTLTLVNVPANKYPSVERTYRKAGGSLVVISTGEVRHRDFSNQQRANAGNGVRFLDANRMMGGFSNIVNGELVINGDKNINEFIVQPREDNNNIVQQGANGGITIGKSNEYAALVSRTGSYVQADWQNADPALIYPGMPMRFMYLIKDLPYEVMGSVSALETHYRPTNADLRNRVFTAQCVVTAFIDKVQNPPKKIG